MDRLPPGQRWVHKPQVLHYGGVPEVRLDEWTLSITGLVDKPLALDWSAFSTMPMQKTARDFHCVTGWSAMDVEWEGVDFTGIAALAGAARQARFVMFGCLGGYTTNVPLEALSNGDALLAVAMNGARLSPEHGAPLRLVVPSKYAWKSAKWVSSIEFMANDRPGFWESNGYHNNGDPWEEERYSR